MLQVAGSTSCTVLGELAHGATAQLQHQSSPGFPLAPLAGLLCMKGREVFGHQMAGWKKESTPEM